ncbi:MAG: zinc dependent phospholipase C family protein [Clostridiaceae bacterium]|nr:zinc dependent phospholipase C family protein [Clostridiaceae bacterium]
MLPQSHVIIAEHLHQSIKEILNVELHKGSLIYGSIKPDIPLNLAGIRHFKPQSFDFIGNEIHQLSQYPLIDNKEYIKWLSKEIGIVTHFIADYFCVPHNDRKTYKNHFVDHILYEKNLHNQYKTYNNKIEITKGFFNVENNTCDTIKKVIDELHHLYSLRGESLINDLKTSIKASSIVGLFIVYHNIINNNIPNAA